MTSKRPSADQTATRERGESDGAAARRERDTLLAMLKRQGVVGAENMFAAAPEAIGRTAKPRPRPTGREALTDPTMGDRRHGEARGGLTTFKRAAELLAELESRLARRRSAARAGSEAEAGRARLSRSLEATWAEMERQTLRPGRQRAGQLGLDALRANAGAAQKAAAAQQTAQPRAAAGRGRSEPEARLNDAAQSKRRADDDAVVRAIRALRPGGR